MKRLAFTPADHARVAAAIRDAEAATSGEIFAVFARESDGYFFVSGFFALLLSLLAGLLAALAAWATGTVLPNLVLEGGQALAVLVLLALLKLSRPLRMLFVPATLKSERAHRMAMRQFLAHNIHLTEARTGVLIFVSEAEHHAEVVADAGIHARVPQAEWTAIVAGLIAAAQGDRMADGFVEAVGAAGRLLAAHFPPGTGNPNEIEDRLVEL